MQIKIKRINKRNTNKEGQPLLGRKDGKPYWNIGIQVEGSDEWYSGFANNEKDPRYLMEEGGTYHIAVEDKKVGDRTYKNFRLLKPDEIKMEEMKAELDALKATKKPTEVQQDLENGMDDKF